MSTNLLISTIHLFISDNTSLTLCDECQLLKVACTCIEHTLIEKRDVCCICRDIKTNFCQLRCNHGVCNSCFKKFRTHQVTNCPLCRKKL